MAGTPPIRAAGAPRLPTEDDLPYEDGPGTEVVIPPLPGEDDLPYSDGIPMESQFHVLQMLLLIETLTRFWSDRQDFFVGGNMFIYFSQERIRRSDFRGPDVFVVTGVPRRLRKSWIVWQEGKGPDCVIELLSESTAASDRTTKKRIYESELRVPDYFWFDPETLDFQGFTLQNSHYEALLTDERGALLVESLGLKLRRWRGAYHGLEADWLRWTDLEGELLPTPEERDAEAAARAAKLEDRAAEAEARVQQEQQRAAEERQRAERLAERLRALGGDADE
jgi:Uma2 family endonuclease